MRYDWKLEILIDSAGSKKVIMQENKVVCNVENFSDEFIFKLINTHNEGISESYGLGLDKGVELARKHSNCK